MAQPIRLEAVPSDPREELRKKLEEAPVQHAEALLDSYQLLQQLHDAGVFNLIRGAIGAGDKILDVAVNAAKSEDGIRALRNAIILGKTLAAINPDFLQAVANATSKTLGCRKPDAQPPGLFTLLAEFRHPEFRRSMELINLFLETLGNELRTRGEC
jgi:uncharacterized protein YjgD (DUF1641 family)